jgi:hypothetical protein
MAKQRMVFGLPNQKNSVNCQFVRIILGYQHYYYMYLSVTFKCMMILDLILDIMDKIVTIREISLTQREKRAGNRRKIKWKIRY